MSKKQQTHYERALAATHSYIGRLPCGCVVAAVVDCGDRYTGKTVAAFVADGMVVERVTHDYVREHLTAHCPHEDKQPEITNKQPKRF